MRRFLVLAAVAGLLTACGGDDGGTADVGTAGGAATTSVTAPPGASGAPSSSASDTADASSAAAATTAATGTDAGATTSTEGPGGTPVPATSGTVQASSVAPPGTTASVTGSTDPSVTASFPVTIEHRYGSTTFDAPPERIVSVDDQWTDVLTALGAPLVAAANNPVVTGGRYPWQDAIPDGVTTIPISDTIPYEAIAAQQPDLIVIGTYAVEQSTYDRLAEIAPTIGPLGDEQVDRWQDMATVAGSFLGAPAAAQTLIDEAAAANAALLAELPGLDGRHYVLANYVPGDAIYVVADPDDGAAELFAQLGMSIDPDILDLPDAGTGRVTLSVEQVELLDADVLLLLANGADPADIPGYALLPAVQSGAVAMLDLATATGLNTPSPLSVPYALAAIRPALEAAAA